MKIEEIRTNCSLKIALAMHEACRLLGANSMTCVYDLEKGELRFTHESGPQVGFFPPDMLDNYVNDVKVPGV